MFFLSKCPVSVLPFNVQGSQCKFLRRYFGLLIILNVTEHVSATPEDIILLGGMSGERGGSPLERVVAR